MLFEEDQRLGHGMTISSMPVRAQYSDRRVSRKSSDVIIYTLTR